MESQQAFLWASVSSLRNTVRAELALGELAIFSPIGFVCDQREEFPAGPRAGPPPGRALGIQHLSQEVLGLKFWSRLGHLSSSNLQLGAPSG